MNKVIVFCAIATTVVLALVRAGSAYTTTASYHFYNASKYDWDLLSPYVSAYCSTWDGTKSLVWRQRYGWTAYCHANQRPIGQAACGRCFQVTNRGTGASRIARIVDQCTKTDGRLDLDYETVFSLIDTDGRGYDSGHLQVDYDYVAC